MLKIFYYEWQNSLYNFSSNVTKKKKKSQFSPKLNKKIRKISLLGPIHYKPELT